VNSPSLTHCFSTTARSLSLVGGLFALAASLVACSSSSTPVGSFEAARSDSHRSKGAPVSPVSDRIARSFRYGLPHPGTLRLLPPHKGKPTAYVFVGDQLNDAIYVSRASDGSPVGTIDTPLPVWGLATDPVSGDVYAGLGTLGVSNGQLLILSPDGSQQLGLLTNSSCCSYGIAVQNGNVYATNWTGACGPTAIDVFSSSQTSGDPASTIEEPDQLVYGLSSDGSNLYAQGWNLTCQSSLVEESANGGSTWSTTRGSGVSAYPGGVASASKGVLIVDDQDGVLYAYPKKGRRPSGYSYINVSAGNPFDYTAVAAGDKNREVWGANVNYGCGQALCSDGQDLEYPDIGLTVATANGYGETLGVTLSHPGNSQSASEKRRTACPSHGQVFYVVDSTGSTSSLQEYTLQGSSYVECSTMTLPQYAVVPLPLYVDQKENFYVLTDQSILEYARGATQPERTLIATDPIAMVVDSDGTAYVAQRADASIYVYPPGSQNPTSSIVIKAGTAMGIALDNAHDLYVSTYYQLVEVNIPSGQTANLGSIVRLSLLQTTSSGALAGCTYSDNSLCGVLSPSSGPGKISTWRAAFQVGPLSGFCLLPGEQAALTNIGYSGAGIWGWPGPDHQQFTYVVSDDLNASGPAVSPADPLGSPFYSFASGQRKRNARIAESL
jgi:hypothetical protein